MTRPTLEDVARAAGVSRATVSRVVREDPNVTAATSERVREAVQKLGYVPNAAARTLASGSHNTIALVVPEPDERIFEDPFFGLTVAGISRALKSTRFQLVMVFASSPGTSTTKEFLLAGGVAGAIIVSHHSTDGLARAIAALPLPSVFVGAPLSRESIDAPVNIVDTDNVHGGRIVADRMLAHGVKHPASISGPLDMTAAVGRLNGWRDRLEEAGLKPIVAEGDFTMPSGQACAKGLLDEHPEIDGLFVGSDLMAEGALEELESRGIIPGKDIRLIGFDDFGIAERHGMTTVKNPATELGEQAAKMLTRLIAKPDLDEQHTVLPVTLAVRTSG